MSEVLFGIKFSSPFVWSNLIITFLQTGTFSSYLTFTLQIKHGPGALSSSLANNSKSYRDIWSQDIVSFFLMILYGQLCGQYTKNTLTLDQVHGIFPGTRISSWNDYLRGLFNLIKPNIIDMSLQVWKSFNPTLHLIQYPVTVHYWCQYSYITPADLLPIIWNIGNKSKQSEYHWCWQTVPNLSWSKHIKLNWMYFIPHISTFHS